jgi:hypothetical protein
LIRKLCSAVALCAVLKCYGFAQTLSYKLDLAAHTGTHFSQNGLCSNRPFASDAKIWTALVTISTSFPSGYTQLMANFPYFTVSGESNAFHIIVSAAGKDTSELSVAGRSYPVQFVAGVDQVSLQVSKLTFSELGDAVDALASNPSKVQSLFSDAQLELTEYKIELSDPSGKFTPTSSDALLALLNGIDPSSPATAKSIFAQRIASLLAGPLQLTIPSLGDNPNKVVQLKASKVKLYQAANIPVDTTSASAVKQDLKSLSGVAPPASAGVPPIFIVDQPCFNVSLAPSLSGGQTNLAATYQLRYDYFSDMGKAYLKVRSDGDVSNSSSYFQRVSGNADAAGNWKRSGFVISAGGSGAISLSRMMNSTLDEWNATGKAQVQFPTLLFGTLPGSSTNPVLALEAGGIGGNNGTTKSTDFLGKASFTYSARANARLTFDINGNAGFSNDIRFKGKKNFRYGLAQARFSLTKDWDYLVKYECGEKNPDYRKVCGWQSGITAVMGR